MPKAFMPISPAYSVGLFLLTSLHRFKTIAKHLNSRQIENEFLRN